MEQHTHQTDSLNRGFVTIVLITLLFIQNIFPVIPDDWVFYFPWFDEATDRFSTNPTEYRIYSLKVIINHLFRYWLPFIYIALVKISPRMYLWKVDLWWLWMIYEAYIAFNEIMAFGQIQYIHIVYGVVLAILQIQYFLKKD